MEQEKSFSNLDLILEAINKFVKMSLELPYLFFCSFFFLQFFQFFVDFFDVVGRLINYCCVCVNMMEIIILSVIFNVKMGECFPDLGVDLAFFCISFLDFLGEVSLGFVEQIF